MLSGKYKLPVAIVTTTEVWVDLKWRISARGINLGGWPHRQKTMTKKSMPTVIMVVSGMG